MNGVEFSASLETEGYVYLGGPRPARRSLSRTRSGPTGTSAPSAASGRSLRDIMRQDRYRAMSQPDPMDYCEQQIAAYARQNFEWANIWKLDAAGRPAYLQVEEHMARFRAGATGSTSTSRGCAQLGDGAVPRPGAPLRARLLEQQALLPSEAARGLTGRAPRLR